MFIAFDTVAAHTIPRDRLEPRSLPPAAAEYRSVALGERVVEVSLMGLSALNSLIHVLLALRESYGELPSPNLELDSG